MDQQQADRLLRVAQEADFLGHESDQWVERLAPQRHDLLNAVRFLVEARQYLSAHELAAHLWRLWLRLGDVAGGREFLAAVLNVPTAQPSRARALALYGDGALAFRAGEMEQSKDRNDAALEAARAVHDPEAESLALVGLSRVALRDGNYERVRALAAQARQLTSDLEPAAHVAPLHLLAAGTRLAGDFDQALTLYTESLELNRRLGDIHMVSAELHNLGHVELHRGNLDRAQDFFAECTKYRSTVDPYDIAMTHLNQAVLAAARADRAQATELLHRMDHTLQDAGIILDPDDAFEVQWLKERLA